MRKFIGIGLLGFVALASVITGCVSRPGEPFVKRSDKIESFKLVTLGEPGQHFTCKLKLDAAEQEISGVSPAEFPLAACVLTGTIRKTHGDGTLRFRVLSKDATLTFGQLVEPGDSLRFRYHARGVEVWN